MPISYPPKSHIVDRAHLSSMDEYKSMYQRSINDPESFWGEMASIIDFFSPAHRVMNCDFEAGRVAWFEGAKLNAAYNCIDRHLPQKAADTAIIWAKDEPGEYQHISYQELSDHVGRMANVLKAQGVQKGDRVCLYMPMIPELAYAMLACARIGAVHSIVFAGFSAEALRDRVVDADCKTILTANEGLRGRKVIPLKSIVDKALEGIEVNSVLVAKRTDADVPMVEGRDLWLDEALDKERPYCPPEVMDAEDPLFILYTSGSTGKPKGQLHTTAGYSVYAATTHKYVFDYHPGDIYCCAADIGWITGHSYIIYGPLMNGATTVMFESVPTCPDAGRYWQMVDDLGINIFYTAPTALRAIHRFGNEFVTRYKRDSLRILGSVGEPINPEVWEWYHDVVGGGHCDIVDTWWQTETGGIMITPLPGVTPTKPGSATLPFFGVKPLLIDDDGNTVEGNDASGNLCIGASWPGQARTIYGNHHRYLDTYFATKPGVYFAGDGCRRDEDGYYWITGRVDDVLNVSGHRLGTAEVESALVAHEAVSEAAVVGMPHDVKGTGIYAYVIPSADLDQDEETTITALREQVRKVIGPIATPDHIQIVPGLPKTRSGKIMRRILRKIAAGHVDELGDISTLADPDIVQIVVDGSRKTGS